MTNKIFRSSFFTSALVMVISLSLVIGILMDFIENQVINELKSEAEYISYAIEDSPEEYLKHFSAGGKRITLIAADGRVIADTSADAAEMDNHAERREVRQAMESGTGISTRYSDTLTEKTVYYAKRLDSGSILRVSATHYTQMTILLGLAQPLIFVLVIALLLSFILSSRVSKAIIYPINSLDMENPENNDTYEELAPLLEKIAKQKRTIRRQLAEAKKQQEEFRVITENMEEGFLVIDSKMNLLSSNSAALSLLGTDKNDGNVLTLNRSESFRGAIGAALSGKRSESEMLHGEQTYKLIANPVQENGAVIGAVIIILDITESTKRELLRREFTANVSHELKTPLTSISGFAELMKAGSMPEEMVMDFSASIYDEAQRLIALVSDIIKISELDEKNGQLATEAVDLHELAEEAVKILAPSAEKKQISFTIEGGKTVITGVRKILEEMIYNLCDNAVKYNRNGGSVRIVLDSDDKKASLEVRDTGIGIPAAYQGRVFERFFRVDKSRSKAEGGTGLGLSIVKHGAMYHGAELSLESKPGVGTAIKLVFNKNDMEK